MSQHGKNSKMSVAFGVAGLIVPGLVALPLPAIWFAGKEKAPSRLARTGRLLGYVGLAVNIIQLVWIATRL
jgi:hypothetical protein